MCLSSTGIVVPRVPERGGAQADVTDARLHANAPGRTLAPRWLRAGPPRAPSKPRPRGARSAPRPPALRAATVARGSSVHVCPGDSPGRCARSEKGLVPGTLAAATGHRTTFLRQTTHSPVTLRRRAPQEGQAAISSLARLDLRAQN